MGNKPTGSGLALYAKTVHCPFCEYEFATMKVRSRMAAPYAIDSDFCPHYREGTTNPNYYYVNVCPECGFAFTEEFTKEISLEARAQIKLRIGARWEKRDFGQMRDELQAIESFKLAIFAATLKKEKHALLGGLCLRLAWIYRDAHNNDEEERFLLLAVKEMEEAYVQSDFVGTAVSEMQVLYLTAELHRRLGNYQEAVNYFSKVTEHPNRNNERRILILAREQWALAMETFRKKK